MGSHFFKNSFYWWGWNQVENYWKGEIFYSHDKSNSCSALTDIIIQTGITCKKIPRYTCDSACRWRIDKKAKLFLGYVEHLWILPGVRNCRILIGLCKVIVWFLCGAGYYWREFTNILWLSYRNLVCSFMFLIDRVNVCGILLVLNFLFDYCYGLCEIF